MIIKKSLNKVTGHKPKFQAYSVERIADSQNLYASRKSGIPLKAGKRYTLNAKMWILSCNLIFCILTFALTCYAQEEKGGPVIVNGDTVEYSTTGKEVIATGNVEITYKGAKLTCDKITVNTETKDGLAEGNVRIKDARGLISGPKATYNFNAKSGTFSDAEFQSSPYFGRADQVDKISDAEFIARYGYMSTCSFDSPHYRIKSKKIDFFPNDKVQLKNSSLLVGKVPVAYLPRYNHSLKDPLMHVQFVPGKSKDWGPFMLSAWRYNLAENLNGRIYLDYREKLGVAEGFGLNYGTHKFGRGDYKFYYTQERSCRFNEGVAAEFQRYFIRWRHKWDVDERTNVTAEYYEINDSKRAIHGSEHNFLKDYFFREYESDTQPPTYVLAHHAFSYSSLDFLLKKRTNRWYDTYLEKLPEVKYSLPSVEIGESPFYFENSSSVANLNKKMTVHSSTADIHVNRLDTTNKISLPARAAFIQLKPFAASRQTFYDKDIDSGFVSPRTIFYSGIDASTKFYRVFNATSDFLGMDINGLRHIITPTIGYAYNHEPTIPNSHLRQLDEVDALSRSNNASLELSNKLQTKRNSQTLDFLDCRLSTNYVFKPKTGDKLGSNFSDLLMELTLLPYSWVRFDGDATYKHSGNRSEENYRHLSNANYDLNFDLGKSRSLGIGQRYQRKGGNEITHTLNWWFSPKWKFSLYQRRNIGHDPTLKRGLREQEYSLSRDLHCWTFDITYNVKRGEGESIWLVFKLKAFPEIEFGYDQTYHQPKPGSQVNP